MGHPTDFVGDCPQDGHGGAHDFSSLGILRRSLFLAFPEIVNEESILIAVMPEMCYRESILLVMPDIFNWASILAFFGWIPATYLRGRQKGAALPDIVNRESLPIRVIPDSFYRESILVFFGWIPATHMRG